MPITWVLSAGLAGMAAHGDLRALRPLLLAPGPLPSYAADTAGSQLHAVPVLRVSHAEEEGEDS